MNIFRVIGVLGLMSFLGACASTTETVNRDFNFVGQPATFAELLHGNTMACFAGIPQTRSLSAEVISARDGTGTYLEDGGYVVPQAGENYLFGTLLASQIQVITKQEDLRRATDWNMKLLAGASVSPSVSFGDFVLYPVIVAYDAGAGTVVEAGFTPGVSIGSRVQGIQVKLILNVVGNVIGPVPGHRVVDAIEVDKIFAIENYKLGGEGIVGGGTGTSFVYAAFENGMREPVKAGLREMMHLASTRAVASMLKAKNPGNRALYTAVDNCLGATATAPVAVAPVPTGPAPAIERAPAAKDQVAARQPSATARKLAGG